MAIVNVTICQLCSIPTISLITRFLYLEVRLYKQLGCRCRQGFVQQARATREKLLCSTTTGVTTATAGGHHSANVRMLENTVASSTTRGEVDYTKRGGTRVAETALEPQLFIVIYNWTEIIPTRNRMKMPLGK